jgi:hypothetical protein
MTGYVVPRTILKLVFVDAEYEGMEVRVKKPSLEEAFRATDLRWQSPNDTVQDIKAHVAELHSMFVDHLVDWNLTEEDGAAVPETLAGLLTLEGQFVGLLLGTWLDSVTGVSRPLPKPSGSGGSSPPTEAEAMLTEIPSESLAS